MAKLDFPVATADGQVWIGTNGVIYTYVGAPPNGHWIGSADASNESLTDVFVQKAGDNMTGNLTLGTDKITLNAGDGSARLGEGNILIVNGNNTKAFTVTNTVTVARSQIGIYGATNATQARGRITLDGVDSLTGDNLDAVLINRENFPNQIKLKYDGSSEFAGDMAIGIDGSFTPSTPAISLNADGSITGQGTLKVGDGRGEFIVFPTGSTRIERKESDPSLAPALRIWNNGDENAVIYADGSGDFQGNVNVGKLDTTSNTAAGVRLAAATGAIQLQRPTADTIFTINEGNNRKVQWSADGYLVLSDTDYTTPSITLDPVNGILVGGVQPSAPAISLNADGSAIYESWVLSNNRFDARGSGPGQANFVGRDGRLPAKPTTFNVINDGRVFIGDDIVNNVIGIAMTPKGDIQSTSQNGGQLAGFRNQIINGDFRIWQRGTSFNLAGQTFTADRWLLNSASAKTTEQMELTQPCQFRYRLRTSIPATQQGSIIQPIELPGNGSPGPFINGSVWTFSFWSNVDFSAVAPTFRFADSSNDSANLVPVTDVPNFTDSGNTLESNSNYKRWTCTFTVNVNPLVSSTCLNAQIPHTSFGTVNVNYVGFQLEPGPVATPFEHRPIGIELALCQRYYYQYDNGGSNSGLFMTTFMGGSATRSGYTSAHPQTMRATPTVTNLTVRDHPNASATDTGVEYLVLRSADDTSGSNRFPAIYSFNIDAEL